MELTIAMNGYQPQTVPVRAEAGSSLQPNPVYVELQPRCATGADQEAPRQEEDHDRRPRPGASDRGRCHDRAARQQLPLAATAAITPLPRLSSRPRSRDQAVAGMTLDALADISQNY
jgi:hypothetical protein